MSIFSELILPKVLEISDGYTKRFNEDLTVAFEALEKLGEECRNEKVRRREKAQKDKVRVTNLQSINEVDSEGNNDPEIKQTSKSNSSSTRSSSDSNGERASKKRSKNEVEDLLSPAVDKRQKRNASVKAQSNIAKQVNVNLNGKLRRDDSNVKSEKTQSSRSRRRKDDEKENFEPTIAIQIKEEKISLPPEPMEMDLPWISLDIPVKQENKDEIAMPPPAVPKPKPRKAVAKEKPQDVAAEDSGKRSTRTKKQNEVPQPQVVTRSSSRTNSAEEEEPTEVRPKRTRAKKKVSVSNSQNEKDSTQTSQECSSATASPADKPRPKRTRRGKAAAKEAPKPVEPIISPKEKRISHPTSPILQEQKPKKKGKNDLTTNTIESTTINSTVSKLDLEETRVLAKDMDKTRVITIEKNGKDMDTTSKLDLEETRVLAKDMDKTRVITIEKNGKDMDTTVVLPNGVYSHAPVTPQNKNMNETMVIEKTNRETIVVEKVPNAVMDATVVLEKGLKSSNMTEDNSLITDDESEQEIRTPPKNDIKPIQPLSAVKDKVQQFEELATRMTRTKTRAMAKKEEQSEQTPPDKISKPILSAETLTKMNSLIFNGKAPQVSSSASKPKASVPTKSMISSSTSKLSSLSRHKEAADELKSSRIEEDARKKKEAMLEAKREQQKRKREDKMAAAAAARSNAERERKAQLELAAKERMEKQAHADAGKLERLKEAERKKQELARKVAETEERRKAEETARMQRLADEQRKALAQRQKQIQEQEAMKKEALAMAKEIEKRNKEYHEKQRIKSRIEEKMQTPLRTAGTPCKSAAVEPVYMADGFQYLNSDEDAEPTPRPVLEWCTNKGRKHQLDIQSHVAASHIERLFSVRVHSPDLREIFPDIERHRIQRTSSAVWRTPPHLLTTVVE